MIPNSSMFCGSRLANQVIEKHMKEFKEIDYQSISDIDLVAHKLSDIPVLTGTKSIDKNWNKKISPLRKIDRLSQKAQISLNYLLNSVQRIPREKGRSLQSVQNNMLLNLKDSSSFVLSLNREQRGEFFRDLAAFQKKELENPTALQLLINASDDQRSQPELTPYREKILGHGVKLEIQEHHKWFYNLISDEILKEEFLIHSMIDEDPTFYERYFPLLNQNTHIVEHAVNRSFKNLKYSLSALPEYHLIALKALREFDSNLQFIDPAMSGYDKLATAAVEKNVQNLRYVDKRAGCYQDLVVGALKKGGGKCMKLIDQSMPNFPQIALAMAAYPDREFQLPPFELTDDRDAVLKAIANRPDLFRHASDRLKGDWQVALRAVTLNASNLKHVGPNLKDDETIVLTALRQIPSSFQYAGEIIRGDRDIALLAVELLGVNLQHLSAELRGNRKIAAAAIKEDFSAFGFADKKLRRDITFFPFLRLARFFRSTKLFRFLQSIKSPARGKILGKI